MKSISLLKLSVIVSLFVVVFTSCNKGPIYKSVAEDKMQKEIQYIGFDNQSAIRYAISNDKEFLYVRLEALSRPSVLKIIQSGFYIYIDTLGKREKNIWLNFPLGHTDQVFSAKLFRKTVKENAAEVGKIELESQIKDVGKAAIFGVNETEEELVSDLEKGFAFHLESGEYGSLAYYAAIRLDKIKKGGFDALDNLSIGIISGAFKKPNIAGSGGRGGGRSNRYAGMNRVPQAQSNIDPKKMREMYLMSQPINFWINVQLYKD
ncbi:MAG: hypothetical protein J7K39_04615 [Bacteroidales bacterium]|nr:hypothetical protein [Bacteroidales bacterium]